MRKQFFVEYESDRFNRGMYNKKTKEYGCNVWDAGNASTIRSAKSIIRSIGRTTLKKILGTSTSTTAGLT